MKKLHRFMSRYLLVLVLLLNVTVSLHAQPCLQDKIGFALEHHLDVLKPPYIIDENAIAANEQLFKDHVRCPGNSPCPSPTFAVKALDVVTVLYKEANDFLKSPASPCADNKCITGLWIIMAMENQMIRYYFQPAVFKANPGSNGGDPVFESVFQGGVYTYVGQFNPILANDLAKNTKAYYDGILIKHFRKRGKHEHGRFKNSDGSTDDTWRGDARKVFYSFQEILGFYSLLNPKEDADHQFYCHQIYVNHSAGLFTRLPKNIWNSWRVKHNTFITVDNDLKLNDRVSALSESTNGSDLAHVCPSNCSSLSYPNVSRVEELIKAKKRR